MPLASDADTVIVTISYIEGLLGDTETETVGGVVSISGIIAFDVLEIRRNAKITRTIFSPILPQSMQLATFNGRPCVYAVPSTMIVFCCPDGPYTIMYAAL